MLDPKILSSTSVMLPAIPPVSAQSGTSPATSGTATVNNFLFPCFVKSPLVASTEILICGYPSTELVDITTDSNRFGSPTWKNSPLFPLQKNSNSLVWLTVQTPGNAFTEFAVFGVRAGRFAAEHAKKSSFTKIDKNQLESLVMDLVQPMERKDGVNTFDLRNRIQKLSWEKIGPVRTGEKLMEAIKEIDEMKKESKLISTVCKDLIYNKEWVEAIQVKNMILVVEVIARAALIRTESRGANYRKDFPYTDNVNWLKNIIIKKVADKMDIATQPIIITKLNAPKEIFPYGPTR